MLWLSRWTLQNVPCWTFLADVNIPSFNLLSVFSKIYLTFLVFAFVSIAVSSLSICFHVLFLYRFRHCLNKLCGSRFVSTVSPWGVSCGCVMVSFPTINQHRHWFRKGCGLMGLLKTGSSFQLATCMNGGWWLGALSIGPRFFRMCVCRLVRVGSGRDGRRGKVFLSDMLMCKYK